jgi:hypothetical protein
LTDSKGKAHVVVDVGVNVGIIFKISTLKVFRASSKDVVNLIGGDKGFIVMITKKKERQSGS